MSSSQICVVLIFVLAITCAAQPPAAPVKTETKAGETTKVDATAQPKPWLEIYGFAQLDAGYEFKQTDPNWFDVMRPVKLPSFKNQFAPDGNTFFSVRQSRLGAKSEVPTELGVLKTVFEFELMGTGKNAGETTFRLRHAYGEIGRFGGGQTWSPFVDVDAFPNTVEYWGPSGMALYRNIQFRFMPMMKPDGSGITLAIERPGASADQGAYADRIELQNVKPHFPSPDFSANAKLKGEWGHVQIAGIARRIEWEDVGNTQFNLSGGVWGWGINFTGSWKPYRKTNAFKYAVVYGKGIENYMNDAPEDIGPEPNPNNTITPLKGVPLPLVGLSFYYDHYWNDKWSSTIGYSRLDIDNSVGQAANAYRTGQYASTNLLFYPVKNMLAGVEFIYGHRHNFSDGWGVPDYRIHVAFKYNFSYRMGGND
jgi:hypothetical protein